jgi:outer membrane protein assembly factor BamB
MVSVVGTDGKIAWTFKTANGSNANSLPVTDGRVAAFTGDKSLFVCDAATGAGLWSMDLDTTNSGIYGRRPVILGEKLFLGTDTGLTVYALKTGKQLGRVAIPDGCDMSPAIGGGKLYIASRSGVFYTIDPISLTVEKQVSSNAGQTVASAAAVGHRFAVFTDRKGFMVSVDIEKNTVAWQKKIDETRAVDVFVDPVLSPAGLYITAKGSLYGFDPATGAALFVPVTNITTSPLASGRSLWCGAKGNMLVEISASTGAVLRKIPMPAEVSGAPVRIGNDIAVPLMDGKLLVIGRL